MTTTPEGRRELKALAEKAAELNWSLDEYGTIRTPDRRTAEVNGFASICGYGEPQKAAKARARLLVDLVKAFPSLLAALEEAREREAEQTKAFDLLVSTVLAARTTNTRTYMEGLADDLNVALAAFGDPDRVAFERGSFSVVRATTKSGEA